HTIDLAHRPGRSRVGSVREQRDDAEASRVRRRKLVGQHKLRDTVAVGVVRRDVDHAVEARGEHVSFPPRVLVPDQLFEADGQRHASPPSRMMPLPLSFRVTCPSFVNACAWIFACGCRSLWAGGDALCNVHLAHGRHCPFCSHGTVGYAAIMLAVCLPQLAASTWAPWTRGV